MKRFIIECLLVISIDSMASTVCIGQQVLEYKGREGSSGNIVFLYTAYDLRLYVLPEESITSLEKRSKCLFQMNSVFEGMHIYAKSQEVDVEGKKTVKDILDIVGWGAWTNGKPQIKLISRNRMVQSPKVPKKPWFKQDMHEFVTTIVKPGDLLIVAVTE